MSLSIKQIDSYRQNGCLVVENVIETQVLERAREVTAAFVERSAEVSASDEEFDLGPAHCAEKPAVRRLKDPHLQHAIYDEIKSTPKLLDIVEALLGRGVRFDHSKLNFKPANSGAAIEWHQDWAFYPHTNDDMLAVGVLLEDCDERCAPLMVVPGSHRGPTFDHHHEGCFAGAIDPASEGFDSSSAVALTGRAGSITLHHVRAIHGSRENQTDSLRPLLLLSYMALDAWPLAGTGTFTDFADFESRALRGVTPTVPRVEALPIRLPFPDRPNRGSIFEDQAPVRGRSFETG